VTRATDGDVSAAYETVRIESEEAESIVDFGYAAEDGAVAALVDDGSLQALESFLALAVQERHVDVEQAQETVRSVFYSRCRAACRPAHASGYARVRCGQLFGQELFGNSGDGLEHWQDTRSTRPWRHELVKSTATPCEAFAVFVPNDVPISIKEDTAVGREQFLQRPASREPFAFAERTWIVGTVVVKPYETLVCGFVPLVHGIDGLGKLCAAPLVDAAGVYPGECEASVAGYCAEFYDLSVTRLVMYQFPILAVLFERDLIVAPPM
jgi:hypothetical protein